MKQAGDTLAPAIGITVGAKSKSPQVGQAATNRLSSKSGWRVLSLTDMLGNGLRLRVIWICFKKKFGHKMSNCNKVYWSMMLSKNVVNVKWCI